MSFAIVTQLASSIVNLLNETFSNRVISIQAGIAQLKAQTREFPITRKHKKKKKQQIFNRGSRNEMKTTSKRFYLEEKTKWEADTVEIR